MKSEHILYMIPRKLRGKIVQVYEEGLPNYDKALYELREKYQAMMYKSITSRLRGLLGGQVMQTSSPHVASLSALSHSLLEGKIPEDTLKNMETAFLVVKEDSNNFPQVSLQDYFEYWKNQMREDTDFKQFEEMRKETIKKVREINETIRKDLESEN